MGQVTHVFMALTLLCEGADMNEGQLMGDLELDSKQLEAESWSQVVDSTFLQQQNKDVVKRQDVIYGERCLHFNFSRIIDSFLIYSYMDVGSFRSVNRNIDLVSSEPKVSL